MGSGTSSPGLSTADLLAIAQAAEPSVTRRTLEYWRNQDLLPHPERTGQDGTRPVWSYPAGTDTQLRALLRMRTLTKDPGLLRAALWISGYPVPVTRAQSSMITAFRDLRHDAENEIARRSASSNSEDGRAQAISEIARGMARRRKAPIPRLSRQSLAERTRAVEIILKLGLDDALPREELTADGAKVERVIGVHRARHYRPGGSQPWLTGPADEGLIMLQELGSLPKMIAVLESASTTEFEQARPFARTMIIGISAFSQMADAFAGFSNAAGLAAAVPLQDQPLIAIMILAWVITALRSPVLAGNMLEVNAAFAESILPARAAARELATLPEAERQAKLSRLAWRDRRRLERIIEVVAEDDST